MKKGLFRRGQSLTEIALIIGIVGTVLIGMEIYIKRGLQGKVKDLTDNMLGREQSVYQQDTAGLEVNTSKYLLDSAATAVTQDKAGGVKSASSVERSTTRHISYSEDN